jgi:hypothetical protein
VESDPALVKNEDGIIQFQVRQGVGDGKDDAPVLAGEVMEQTNDLPLGSWVEAGGDLVAQE